MILLVALSLVLAAAFAAQAAMLSDRLRVARGELAAFKRRPVSPPPSAIRQFEGRLERSGLLWFPVLTAKDGEKLVIGASSGLPYCGRCIQPLKIVPGRREQWRCAACGALHPAMAADLAATDEILAGCLREFFARHPDYAPAPGLSAPKLEPAGAA